MAAQTHLILLLLSVYFGLFISSGPYYLHGNSFGSNFGPHLTHSFGSLSSEIPSNSHFLFCLQNIRNQKFGFKNAKNFYLFSLLLLLLLLAGDVEVNPGKLHLYVLIDLIKRTKNETILRCDTEGGSSVCLFVCSFIKLQEGLMFLYMENKIMYLIVIKQLILFRTCGHSVIHSDGHCYS